MRQQVVLGTILVNCRGINSSRFDFLQCVRLNTPLSGLVEVFHGTPDQGLSVELLNTGDGRIPMH